MSSQRSSRFLESSCPSQAEGKLYLLLKVSMMIEISLQTSHKRTFLYLEQIILKHRLHTTSLRIKETHEGLDFFYANKQEARKLVEFISSSVPCRCVSIQVIV